MHSFVISKNVKWCHLIWPTRYMLNKPNFIYSLYMYRLFMKRRIWKSHWAEKEYSCT